MAKVQVKPKSQILYDELRTQGMKKKKAAKVANGFVVTRRGDTSSSRSSRKRAPASGTRKTNRGKKTSTSRG